MRAHKMLVGLWLIAMLAVPALAIWDGDPMNPENTLHTLGLSLIIYLLYSIKVDLAELRCG